MGAAASQNDAVPKTGGASDGSHSRFRDTAERGAVALDAGAVALRNVATFHEQASAVVQSPTGGNAYIRMQQEVKGTLGGGLSGESFSGGYFGGDPSDEPSKALKEYHNSLAWATKDRLVQGLARALERAGIDVDPNASSEEIARALQSKLPNPRKGKTFAADAKAQEKVCRTIADVLNDEFTPGAKKSERLIDTSLGAVSVCRQVAEIVYSLSTGLQTEFLEVHASLTRILRNLEVLNEVIKELHESIRNQVTSADLPTGADKKIQDMDKVYDLARGELDRQLSLLKNMLNVTLAPAKEELAIAMRTTGEDGEDTTYDMIKRLKLVPDHTGAPGTGDFANTLAEVVSGLGTVAAISARVDKALLEVGMNVNNYLESNDLSALVNTLDNTLTGSPRPADVGKFIAAVKTLKDNFSHRSELDLGTNPEISGGYQGGEGGGESKLDKRVKQQKMEKKLIVTEFIRKSTAQYDALLKSIQVVGPLIGKTIPLSDKLEELRNALSRLNDAQVGKRDYELSLLGFYGDAQHRSDKEQFLTGLRVVQNIIDDLMGMEIYRDSSSLFASIRADIEGLVRTIDFYSDVITRKYGSGDGVEGGSASGGGDDDLSDIPGLARSSYDLTRAVNTFLYFYYVAKVRTNLSQTHKELDFYGEQYVDILGDAVGARLRQIIKDGKLQKDNIDTLNNARKITIAAVANHTADDLVRAEAHYNDITAFHAKQLKCKANFYKALQALDLYMKAFTDSIVAHPDDVADIKSQLDYDVIGRWFIEDTGNDLAAAFDLMGGWDGGGRQIPDVTVDGAGLNRTGHYYEKLAASTEHNNIFVPGVPQLPVSGTDSIPVQDKVNKTYDNFQALKNITNAFVRIGEKFGGKELRRQVFMSPTQMYKFFMDYLKCSALSYGAVAGTTIRLTNVAGGAINVEVAPDLLAANDLTGNVIRDEGVYFSSTMDGLKGDFETEDRYFTYCVKAMAAKVLTVLGVYDLFERPSPVYDLTPTRMIIGGALEEVPEAIPEAAELYFRLPRLVEFYKDLFDWDANLDQQISMLSEMEGVFSGIIRLLFHKIQGDAVKTGNYSDIEVNSIVREINNIYDNFKGSNEGGAIKEALSAFVMEINRRYGVVKKKDWDLVQSLQKDKRRDIGGPLQTSTNYSILPGEEEGHEVDRRAPSDRYLGTDAKDFTERDSKFKIDSGDWAQWDMLKEFRAKLDGKLRDVNPADFTSYSFSSVIRQGELEMKRMASASERIGVASRLIQGSSNLAGVDVSKHFMFHETVVVGLNTLSGIYTLLNAFRTRVVDTDVVGIRKAIKEWVQTAPAGVINSARMQAQGGAVGWSATTAGYVHPDNFNIGGMAGAPVDTLAEDLYTGIQVTIATVVANNGNGQAGAPGNVDGPAATMFSVYTMNNVRIMRDLITIISSLSNSFQGLVTTRFPNTRDGTIHLDFSGMRSMIQGLMDDVRYFMDLFRPHISKDVIAKYENIENPGSLYWLESKLIDGLVRGKPDDMSQDLADRDKTFEWMSRTINSSYAALIQYHRFSMVRMIGASERAARTNVQPNLGQGDLTGVTLDGGETPVLPQAGVGTHGTAVLADINSFFGNVALNVAQQTAAATGQSYYQQFGNLFCELVFYDSGYGDLVNVTRADVIRTNSGIINAAPGAMGGAQAVGLDALISASKPRPPGAGQLAAPNYPLNNIGAGAEVDSRLGIWDSQRLGLRDNRSIVMLFNQMIAKYIHVFYDATSGKIYRNLIDSFANGSFSRSVMTPGHSMPDMATGAGPNSNFGVRGDPTTSGVLAQSLALILQRLVTDINSGTQISDHLVATLSEIPLYIRESYRVNLPAYIKLFEQVQKKGEFLKQLMSQTKIQVGRWRTVQNAAEAALAAAAGPQDRIIAGNVGAQIQVGIGNNTANYARGCADESIRAIQDSSVDSEAVKSTIVGIIDSVSAGCYTLSNASAEVLRELADEALFLQTQENSIQEYKARYGKMPLMPLSSSLTYLRNINDAYDNSLFPEHVSGDQRFKMMYGVRRMLAGPAAKFTLADAPGVRANIDEFNGTASGREKIDPSRYEHFLSGAVSGLRFLVDTRHYQNIITPAVSGEILRTPLTAGANPAGEQGIIIGGALLNSVYSIRSNLQEVLAVTESSFQKQEMKKISDTIVNGAGRFAGNNIRETEWIHNIIDMNIIPINVHALMRGIPLAPMYNYVYTFEQMISLMYGENVASINGMVMDVNNVAVGVKNTRQAFLKMMANPYQEVTQLTYGRMPQVYAGGMDGLIQRTFRGDDSLMMGRPKFLSDEVYNKALFGALIPTTDSFDETGPAGAGRIAARRPVLGIVRNAGQAPNNAGLVQDGDQPTWGNNAGLVRTENPPGAPNFNLAQADLSGYLTFIGNPGEEDSHTLKRVQLGRNAGGKLRNLEKVGKARFDTRIVRNLYFITNVQRLMRLKLNQELTQYRSVLVSNHSVINAGVTEYGSLPASHMARGHHPLGAAFETSTDRQYDDETRYND